MGQQLDLSQFAHVSKLDNQLLWVGASRRRPPAPTRVRIFQLSCSVLGVLTWHKLIMGAEFTYLSNTQSRNSAGSDCCSLRFG
jgi:hypothetical protein